MDGLVSAAVYLLLFGLVISLAYLVPRLLGQRLGATARGRRLRVVEVLPLGRDRALILVAVAGRYLLVGSGPQGFTLIATFSDPDSLAHLNAAASPAGGPEGESAAADPFRRALQRFLEKGQR